MTVNSSELGVFWMRERAKALRDDAAKARAAFHTPFMVKQTEAVAVAYEAAADVIERHAFNYENFMKQPDGARRGVV